MDHNRMDATQPVWTCGCNIPHYALTDADKGLYKCPFGCGQTYGEASIQPVSTDTQTDTIPKPPKGAN